MTDRSVIILGANGRFGLAAALAFSAAGWQVLAQARRPLDPALPAHTRRIDLPLEATAALAEAARGASVVVHAVNPAYTDWDSQLLPLARAGMDLAQRLGARFMLPTNVYNFGAGMPPLLSEDTPQHPTTPKGRLRCMLEAELATRGAATACQPPPLRSTTLRAGDFFGCGAGSWLDLVVLKGLKQGKLTAPGPLDVPHAWAYLPDLARAFVALAELDQAAPERLPVTAAFHFTGHTLSNREFLDATERAARALGLAGPRPMRRGSLPWGLMRGLAWAVPMWRELLRMGYLWRVPHALDGRRLAQALGPVPSTPIDEALQAALRTLYKLPAGTREAWENAAPALNPATP